MASKRLLLLASTLSAVGACAAQAQPAPQAETEVSEVIVRGAPLRHAIAEMATPVASLAGDALVQRRQATIGETLQGIPGVNADTFGAGASRPVIRGQSAPRVKVLSDGAELLDASQVSPDHAVTAEPLLLKGVEVFRGPSALVFGGGAIAGAVNLVDEKIPTAAPAGGMEGVAELRTGDNGKERAGVFGVTIGGDRVAFRAEGVRRTSENYEVAGWDEPYVDGTFNDTSTLSFGGSWLGARGYIGGAYTLQRSQYGLPGHEHEYEACHPHGVQLHCGGHSDGDDVHDHGEEEEEEAAPSVRLKSKRWDVRGELRDPLAGIETLRLRASGTRYRHGEIEDGSVATTFANRGYDLRLEAEHRTFAGWRGVVGVQASTSDFSALGEEAFLPATDTHSQGLFIFEERNWSAWHFEMAARQDRQQIKGSTVAAVDHRPLSFSASALWRFAPGYSAALAISRSQRAPTAQELHADGVHLATNTFEVGEPALDVETARTIDLTLRKTTGATTFTVGVFHHDIADYIFADTLDQFEDFRLIRYAQMDARFTGVDAEATHRFTPQLAATVFGDYVRGRLMDGADLPRIPAARLGLRGNAEVGAFAGELELYRAFKQENIAAFEVPTPAYDMVNATLSYTLPAHASSSQVYVRATNLLDELAFNHASFISRAAPLRGRTFVIGVSSRF